MSTPGYMDSKEWRLRFLEFLCILLELPQDDQEQRLDELCGDDQRMKVALKEALLDASSSFVIDSASTSENTPGKGASGYAKKGFVGRELLGKYLVIRRLGEGGQGVVYLAINNKLGEFVAIKFITSKSRNKTLAGDRIKKEAQLLARLRHPNICSILDMDITEEGLPFIVMEYLEGKSLEAHLQLNGPLPTNDALVLLKQLGDALAFVHERQIVHQDIKPANIMLCAGEQPNIKLLDFGVAHVLSGQQSSSGGTAPYMSPEQIRNDPVDYRTDIWSLGITILEMLTGEHPMEASGLSLKDYRDNVLGEGDFHFPVSVGVLHTLLRTCLEKDRNKRYRSTKMLVEDIQDVFEAERKKAVVNRYVKSVLRYASFAVFIVGLTWYLVSPQRVFGKRSGIGVVFSQAGEIQSGVTPNIKRWLAKEFDYLIPHLLSPNEDNPAYIPTELVRDSAVDNELLFYGVNVTLDAQLDSIYVTLDLRNPQGLVFGRPERLSLGHDYRSDHNALVEALYRLLSQKENSPFNPLPEAVASTAKKLPGIVSADSLTLAERVENGDSGSSNEEDEEIYSDPDSTWIAQGFYYLATGNEDAAIRIFNVIKDNDSLYAPAYLALAEAYWQKGDTARVELNYARADRLYPGDFTILEWWAMHAMRVYDLALAESLLTRAIAIRPGDPGSYRNLGVVYIERGELVKAMAQFQKATELGEDAMAHANMGYIFYSDSLYEEAAFNYEKALALDSTDYQTWGDLAFTYQMIPERKEQAIPAFTKAIALGEKLLELNPDKPDLVMDLAEYYMKLQNAEKSEFYLDIYKGFNSGHENFSYLEDTRQKIEAWLESQSDSQ